jgi:hypothetical protein
MEEAFQNEINFMFVRDANGNLNARECMQLWFGKSNDTDIEIQERFGCYVATALRGKLDPLATRMPCTDDSYRPIPTKHISPHNSHVLRVIQ